MATVREREGNVRKGMNRWGTLWAGAALLLAPMAGAQQYHVTHHWTVGGDELNYRRFFDVTTLAGLRVEDPEVFAATHRQILASVADGTVSGLRVDHPDGLADPQGYLARLSEAARGCWIVVEKILERGEPLPADWACNGTTGYDALNLITGLFVDPAGEAAGAGSPLYKLKAYNTVNFNLAFFLPHNMEVDAYVKNVFDVRGEVSANAFEDQYFNPYFLGIGLPYAPVPVVLSQPRTVGLVLKVATE